MTALDDRPTTAPMTLGDLILEHDRRRPRSQQTALGMSELGGCRRKAGYRLAGTTPTDEGGSVQAALGTAIHDGVADILRKLQAEGVLSADDLIEHPVTFAGIPGRLDHYDAATRTVDDTKSTSQRWLDKVKVDGPPITNRWQVQGYAAGLIRQGYRVDRVSLTYIARDTGEVWRWTAPPNPAEVREALDWLADVRDSDLDMLPRDYEPDGPFCGNCPFRTECWGATEFGRDPRSVLYREDPDAATWAAKLEDARERKRAAIEDEATAKGALDELRPNEQGVAVVDVGYVKALQWRVKTVNKLDNDAVRADYKAAGAEPPTKVSRSVELSFAPRQDGAQS